MIRPCKRLLAAVFTAGSFCAAPIGAQSSGGSYRVDPSTIASGGGTASGGTFRLSGTLGQTATSTMSASSYRFHGGFWAPTGSSSDVIFTNGFDP